MGVNISLYSKNSNDIYNFINSYNGKEIIQKNILKWSKEYKNPIEVVDIIGVFIDNNYKYKINMWLSLDKNFFINVTNNNADKIIRYLFERYPY